MIFDIICLIAIGLIFLATLSIITANTSLMDMFFMVFGRK